MRVAYELMTPQAVQLTPQAVTTLLGDNRFWHDAGATAVTYRADPTMTMERLTAAILSLGSNI